MQLGIPDLYLHQPRFACDMNPQSSGHSFRSTHSGRIGLEELANVGSGLDWFMPYQWGNFCPLRLEKKRLSAAVRLESAWRCDMYQLPKRRCGSLFCSIALISVLSGVCHVFRGSQVTNLWEVLADILSTRPLNPESPHPTSPSVTIFSCCKFLQHPARSIFSLVGVSGHVCMDM
jgi:hypothetical protein